MANAKCPMCGVAISVPTNIKEGNLVVCDSCDAELEVVNVKPLELDWPLDEDEDDYDDFDDDDYDDYNDYDDYDDDED